MRLPLLCALNFAVLAGGMTTTASDLSRPLGDPQLERPTLRSLGVYWIIQGDDNQNAFIGLEYRKAGSSPWRTAARPHHRARPPRRARLGRRHGNRSRFLPGPGTRPEGRGSRRPVPGGSRRLRGNLDGQPERHARPACRPAEADNRHATCYNVIVSFPPVDASQVHRSRSPMVPDLRPKPSCREPISRTAALFKPRS